GGGNCGPSGLAGAAGTPDRRRGCFPAAGGPPRADRSCPAVSCGLRGQHAAGRLGCGPGRRGGAPPSAHRRSARPGACGRAGSGEPVPADKAPGERIFAGTLNGSGFLEARVRAAASDSTLARVAALVEEAQASRSPSEKWVERFARRYTPAVLLLAVLVATLP